MTQAARALPTDARGPEGVQWADVWAGGCKCAASDLAMAGRGLSGSTGRN